MRNLSLAALLLVAHASAAWAEQDSSRNMPRQPTKESVDAANQAAERINILRLRALMKNYQNPPTIPGPAGVAPSVSPR